MALELFGEVGSGPGIIVPTGSESDLFEKKIFCNFCYFSLDGSIRLLLHTVLFHLKILKML
jgi:hypothetical protein